MAITEQIDAFLAAAVRGSPCPWPTDWQTPSIHRQFLERARYQGVTGLILPRAADWPDEVRASLREQSVMRAAWELRHFDRLQSLLREMALRDVAPLFLKGTALAYHVYPEPSARARADSDLLVRGAEVQAAREALAAAGFDAPLEQDSGALQETWQATIDGARHAIDLHFAAFNAPYVAEILPVELCFDHPRPLSALGHGALMLAPAPFLLHVCVHRSLHRTAPYFSGGKALFGADRLIWAKDIALLAGSFGSEDWRDFVELSLDRKVARAMREALRFAEHAAGAAIPADVGPALAANAGDDRRSAYLLEAGRRSRLFANLRMVGSWRQWIGQLVALATPSDRALRARYPQAVRTPRLVLLVRRLFDFATGRAQ